MMIGAATGHSRRQQIAFPWRLATESPPASGLVPSSPAGSRAQAGTVRPGSQPGQVGERSMTHLGTARYSPPNAPGVASSATRGSAERAGRRPRASGPKADGARDSSPTTATRFRRGGQGKAGLANRRTGFRSDQDGHSKAMARASRASTPRHSTRCKPPTLRVRSSAPGSRRASILSGGIRPTGSPRRCRRAPRAGAIVAR